MARNKPRAAVATSRAAASSEPPGWIAPHTPRARRSSHNEAVSAIPPTVLAIFSHAASTGDTSRQTQYYKDARILDPRLDQVGATRVHAISGRPLLFKPPPGFEKDKHAKDIASRCSALWNSTRRTGDALEHLAHGALEGHAGLCQRWVVDQFTGWHRPEFEIEKSHSSLFVWDPDTMAPWYSAQRRGVMGAKPTDDTFPLDSKPDSFLFHSPTAGRADDPWRRGAMRSTVILSLLKRLGLKFWASMMERWGQPQVFAEVDYDLLKIQAEAQNATVETVADEVLGALRRIASDWSASVPKGVTIQEIPVSVTADLHKNFVDWSNVEMAVAMLGQNLSTEATGGSYAAASAHNRIRIDILVSDCASLAETITDQWIAPVVGYNWPGAPMPYAEFVLQPKRELTVAEYQVGLYSADETRTSQGHEQEPEGRGERYFTGPATAGTPTSDGEPSKPSDTREPGPSKPPAAKRRRR